MMKIGGMVGLTTLMMMLMLSQIRIFYSMANDHLLPAFFAKLHSKTLIPWISTLVVGT